MKKILSLLLAMLFLAVLCPTASLAETPELRFREDGTFRILQINDFQDNQNTNAKSAAFLNAVLDRYQPDLVVLAGDQLMHGNNMTEAQIAAALKAELQPMEDRGIPFLFTYGNHDHDHDATLDRAGQAAVYDSYSMCYASHNGPDPGTYNNVIYGSDGVTPKLNVYMMDTNEWYGDFSMSGVNAAQVQWYKDTGSALKAANGENAVPSLVFQHIPVKETFKFLIEVPAGTPGAVDSKFGSQWYILDENADWVGDRNVMKENIACENPSKSTGQYEAWVEQGDIIGAYFGHDHVNTFVGRTEEGIVMGYNGGFGFATYGDGNERFARIYDFNENDVSAYTMKTLYYSVETAPDVIYLYPSETLPEDAMRFTAHRGLSALAPENTLPAYRLAGEYGFWGAECDISQTADGVWVLMHDQTVDRMTDGEGPVSDYTYEELSALTVDAGNCVGLYPGTKVPTLTQYLDVCREYGLHPVIEIKETVDVQNLPDLAAILDAREEKDRFVIISWGRELIAGIKALLPDTPCYLIGGPGTAEDVEFCVENGIDGLDTSYNVSESVIRQAQDAGLKVMAWTVDSVVWAERMAAYGVTDITTNCLVPGRAPTGEPEEPPTDPEEPTSEPTTEPASEPTSEPVTGPVTEPSGGNNGGGSGVSLWQRIIDWFRHIFAVIAGWFGR